MHLQNFAVDFGERAQPRGQGQKTELREPILSVTPALCPPGGGNAWQLFFLSSAWFFSFSILNELCHRPDPKRNDV